MKKILTSLILAVVLTYLIWKLTKKGLGATQMEFDVSDIELPINSFGELMKFIGSGAKSNTSVLVSNFGGERYVIDNIYVELYNKDGNVLIGYQTEPVKNKIVIEPYSNNTFTIPLYLKGNMISQIMKQLNLSTIGEFWNVFQNYLETGHIGTEIMIKGYAVVKGLKLPFKFTKEV